MRRTYSIYEARTRFSEILRRVRERGETVTVSYHGEPVAEIRPIERASGDSLSERLSSLEQSGALVRAAKRNARFRRVARKPGALERFRTDREL
jgi:prevent-host-death family protein